MAEWRNWSGSVEAQPMAVERPRTIEVLQTLVAGAEKVRVVGAGHSFMPLCATDGLLLSLLDLEGELAPAADGQSVWVPAGWPIGKLTDALWRIGFSLVNQGDIDKQA
ncbi:MAG TPA: FAD-binding protein, partial [Caulobacteraceae bacterium]|nr:FAD-binding protein [Caulobacteraceae bacterium]